MEIRKVLPDPVSQAKDLQVGVERTGQRLPTGGHAPGTTALTREQPRFGQWGNRLDVQCLILYTPLWSPGPSQRGDPREHPGASLALSAVLTSSLRFRLWPQRFPAHLASPQSLLAKLTATAWAPCHRISPDLPLSGSPASSLPCMRLGAEADPEARIRVEVFPRKTRKGVGGRPRKVPRTVTGSIMQGALGTVQVTSQGVRSGVRGLGYLYHCTRQSWNGGCPSEDTDSEGLQLPRAQQPEGDAGAGS